MGEIREPLERMPIEKDKDSGRVRRKPKGNEGKIVHEGMGIIKRYSLTLESLKRI